MRNVRDRAGLKGESACRVHPQLFWFKTRWSPSGLSRRRRRARSFGEEDPLQGGVSGRAAEEEEGEGGEVGGAEEEERRYPAGDEFFA